MKDWKEIGASLEKLKKKDNLFILILVGVLLMVITIPVDKKEGKKEEDVIVESTSTEQGTDSVDRDRKHGSAFPQRCFSERSEGQRGFCHAAA